MAHKDVFEGTEVTIRVRLKDQSKNDNSDATITLTIDDTTAGTHDLTIQRNWVEHKHTFANVPTGKNNYQFTYAVKAAEEDYPGEHTYTVWPTWVDITLTNDVTDAPVADAPFKLLFDGDQTSSFRSGSNGKVRCRVKYKALLRGIVSTDTLTFVKWSLTSTQGRDREARVEVPEYAAQLVTPAWKGQTVEQFVNLTSANNGDTEGHDKQGRRIKFNLKLVDKKSPGKTIHPPNNTPIYVKVALTDRAKRNADLADLEGVNNLVSTDTELSGKIATASGKGSFTLVLGRGGLEKYKVQIGTTPACEDATVKLTSMRKLWVGSIGRTACPDISKAVAALRKVGILLEKEDDTVLSDNACGIALVRAADSPYKEDRFIVGKHNIDTFTSTWTATNAPRSAFLVWADNQYDADGCIATLNVQIHKGTKITWPPTGEKVYGVKLDVFEKVSKPKECVLFGKWLYNDQPTIGYIKYLDQGLLADADVTTHSYLDPKKSRKYIWVKAPAHLANDIKDHDLKVNMSINVKFARGPYLGWAPTGGVVIPLKSQSISEASSSLVHEIGHLLHQATDDTPGVAITRANDHKWHYQDRGHSGGHCAWGLPKSLYDKATKSLERRQDAKCVMYGEGIFFTKYDFCVKCTPFVLAETVEKI